MAAARICRWGRHLILYCVLIRPSRNGQLLLMFLAYFPKVDVCNLHPVCISPPPINLSMPEPIFMKFGMYIMATEPNLSGIPHKSLPSVCVAVCVFLLSLLVFKRRLTKMVAL
jgi:hypothetical protein